MNTNLEETTKKELTMNIRKRNGEMEPFNSEKITRAIYKAAVACGGKDYERAEYLTREVEKMLSKHDDEIVDIETIQDYVEKALIENGHAKTAKAYILYREKRKTAREMNALTGAVIGMFGNYLSDSDWQVQENANVTKSVNGLNNYVREEFTKLYWLSEIYPNQVSEMHKRGDAHLHDLGFFGPYCAGWDLRQLAREGFGGVAKKVSSAPAKHFRSFLGQIVNSTFTTQGETAGAQAWSSFDTICAPFVYYDGLDYKQVRQAIQEFIFNMNVPTRVGFQCPFSNLTFDIKVPSTLKDEPVIIGGEYKDKKYGDFQKEMNMINKAFCEVMYKGDNSGQVFTFPIPTLNITKDFDWNNEVVDDFMKITLRYGNPYFANYVNSDLSPEDALSMCCRLRLDMTELRKRGGGLFGSNPLTGSVGVVTINLPRIGYLSETKEEYFKKLKEVADIAKESLEIKRKILEQQTENGLYPYSAKYLKDVKLRTGKYWSNHFSTIGVIGMEESLRNFKPVGKALYTKEGQEFAKEVMNYLRDVITSYQEETGNVYNLEATPAEGTSHRLALIDKKRYPDIITAGSKEVPYYTNSTQLPVGYTDDLFETLELQDDLQCMYTGGTVLHGYTGDKLEDIETLKTLIKTVFTKFKLPYFSYTPTFSICPEHGYILGEHFECPECGAKTEVWSRVVGYLRPVSGFNNGKRQEYFERNKYSMENFLNDIE